MEVVFNFSEEFDREDILHTADVSMKITKNLDGTQYIEVQACGRFVTLEVINNGLCPLRLRECSHEFIVEGMKL